MTLLDHIREAAALGLISAFTKVFITFPLTLLMLKVALHLGAAEWTGYARPTRAQVVLLAAVVALLT